MGLLGESWDDPKTQATLMMAAGLLGGGGFGQAMGRGLQGYQSVLSADAERQANKAYREAQIEQLKSQAAENRMKVEQQKSMQGLLGNIFGPKPTAQASAGDAYMPGMPSAGEMQPGGLKTSSLDEIARLRASGGPDLVSAWEKAQTGLPLDAGKWYQNPLTGQREFIPNVKDGLGVAGNQVVPLPGFAAANAAIKGTEATAVERAKAGLDPMKVYNKQTGQEEFVPRSEVAGQVQMPQAQAQPTPSNADQVKSEQLNYIASEYQKALQSGNTQDAAALKREYERVNARPAVPTTWSGNGAVQQSQPQRFAAGPSSSEVIANAAAEVAAKDTAAADVKRASTKTDEAKRYGQFSEASNRAIDLLKQGPTGSGIGAAVDSAANFFGKSTKGAEVSSQLKTVSGWLVSNVPRMEGPQSNVDVLNYQVMAGNVGNEKLPVEQRLAAAQEVKRLQDKYAELNGGQPKKADAMQAMPTANASNKGRTIRDTETGKLYKSNGIQWTEAN